METPFGAVWRPPALTFFQLLYLLGGEGGPVALQLPLQPHPQRLLLVARVRVVVGVAV